MCVCVCVWGGVFGPCLYTVLSVYSSLTTMFLGYGAGCFTLLFLDVTMKCFVPHPLGALVWSAEYDSSISWYCSLFHSLPPDMKFVMHHFETYFRYLLQLVA